MAIKYQSLDPEKREIRLLKILQAPGDSETIHATLEHEFLDHLPQYTALSYRWGYEQPTRTIFINHEPYEARENLVDALLQLRGAVTGRLWIDAVCIDQENKVEKSNQIGEMMKDIYRSAKSVIAWVGKENQTDATLINGLQTLDPALQRYDQTLIQSLETFLNREFWTRIWIIQEIALAEDITIQCGEQRIDWETFVTATIAISEKRETSPRTDPLYQTVKSLIEFRHLCKMLKDRHKAVNIALLPALYSTWTSQASDPHDKIFALLGLVTDSQRYLARPSYAKSIEDVCQQLTIGVHHAERKLDVIPMLARGYKHTTVLDVQSPSWVPEWCALNGDERKRQLDYLKRAPRYRAAGSSESSISRENDVLTSAAIRVGIISVASSVCGMGEDIGSDTAQSPAPTPGSVQGEISSPYSTSEKTFFAIANCLAITEDEAQYRGAFRDKQITISELLRIWRSPDYHAGFQTKTQEWINEHRSLSFHGRTLQEWAEWMTHTYKGRKIRATAVQRRHKGLESHVKYNVVPGLACVIEEGMRLITTSSGHIGWACSDAQEGDELYILKGCSVPIVLRATGKTGGLFVVGDAYIQDIMQGEFVASKSWGQVAIH